MSKTTKPIFDATTDRAKALPPRAQKASLLASTSFMALEQRMVFDGAAAAHVADTMAHHWHHMTDGHTDGGQEHAVDKMIATLASNLAAGSGSDAPDGSRPQAHVAVDYVDAAHDPAIAALVSGHNGAAQNANQIVFVNSQTDVGSILNSVPSDMRIVLLDSTRDGVDQIAQTLAGQHDIAAIHIVTNGGSADLHLGNADLTAANMATTYAADMATIKAAFAPNADIFVYGNTFGAGPDGAAAASQLSALTGAYVAPAADRTGTIAALVSHDALVADRAAAASNPMQDQLLQSAIAEHNAAAGLATQVAFVESNVTDLADLLIAVPQGTRIVLLDASKNGMDQIAQSLQGMTGITALHILSHGSEGNLDLGTAELNAADMGTTYAADIAIIKTSLAPNADILLYGCNFAAGTDGDAAVHELATLTGANVAASTDITGAAALGGNWVLEDKTGTIAAAAIDATNWNGELTTSVSNGKGALLTVTNNNIYSVDTTSGKATLVTAIPSSIGGVAFSGVANSLAVDQANGLIYYTDNAVSSSNVALFAYDFVNNQHILISSNVAAFGIVPGSVGLGAAGATFGNGKLYLGVDNPSGTEDAIYAVTFTNNGKTIATATHLNTSLPLTNDWGDLGYDPVNNNLLSFSGADLTVTRLDPTTGAIIGTALAMPSGAGYQGSQDMAGDVFAIGTTLQQINPLTGAAIGAAITVTTDGSTALGGANDAAGWTPPTATIEGQVYWDNNTNKINDAGDAPIANVTVQLYSDVNNDGVINGKDALLATDTTDASGQYQFTGALPGDYIVKVTDANGVIGTHSYSTAGGAINNSPHIAIIGSTISNVDFGVANTATAVNDTFTTYDNTPVTIHATANDSDAQGDTFSITAVNGITFDTTTTSVAVTGGSVALGATAGDLVFTPTTGYNGSPSFTYTITDAHGAQATATVSGTVSYAPPIAGDDTFATNANAPVTIPVLANDTDVNGFPLTITKVGTTAITAGGAAVAVTDGTVKLDTSGDLIFTPTANYTGAVPTLTYTISDGHGNTDIANVTGTVNDVPPNANDDTFTTAQGTAVTITELANDTSPVGLPLTVTKINTTAITAGGAAVAIDHGTVSESAAGVFTYTPTAGYNGAEAFTYSISDGHGGTDTANVTGTVYAPPVAVADTFSTGINMPVTIGVLANDADVNGFPLTITKIGSTAITAGGAAIAVTDGSVKLNTDGTLTFTPTTGYTGAVPSFTYTESDGHGGVATATVTGTVADLPPNAHDDTFSTNEDQSATITPLSNDTTAEPFALTVTKINGTAITAGGPAVAIDHGTVALTAAGTFTYTPTAGYSGSEAFTYTISDGHGGTDTANVTGTVVYADHAPSGADHTATTNANAPYTFQTSDFGFTDSGDTPSNNLKAVEITTLPANGTLTDNGIPVTAGQFVSAADIASGNLVWTPDAVGAKPGSFTFQVQDDGGTANGGADTDPTANTMTLALNEVLAQNDANANYKGITQTGNVLTNDTALDGGALNVTQFTVAGTTGTFTAGQTATISGVGALTINADGSYTFAPLAAYTGTAPVATYTVVDASAVPGANLVPGFPSSGGSLIGWVKASNGVAPDGYGINGFYENNDATGTGPLQTIDYSIKTMALVNGQTYDFSFRAVQSSGNPAVVNAQWVLFDPTNTANNQLIGPTISTGGTTGTATGTVLPVSVYNDGNGQLFNTSFVFNGPTGNYSLGEEWHTTVGTVGRDITVSNLTLNTIVPANVNGTATAQLALTVNPYSPPVANADTFVSSNGVAAIIQPLNNDSDPQGLPLTITQINGTAITAGGAGVAVTGGTVTLDTSGDLTYTPTTGYNGSPSFTYTETDGVGTATATVSGTVTNPPLALDLSVAEAGTGHTSTFTQGQGPDQVTAVDETLTGGTGTLTSATVVLTNAKIGDSIVATDIAPGITYNTDTSVPGQITYTMSGAGSRAEYQALIQSLQFSNASLNPDTTPRTISISATDGAKTTNVAVATVNVVHVDQAPVIGAGAPVYVDANNNGQYDAGESNPTIINGTLSAGASAANDKTFVRDFDIPAGTDPNQVRLVVDLSQDDNSFKLAINGTQIVSPVIANLDGTDASRSPFSELVVASTGQDISQCWVGNANGLPRVEMVITNDGVQFWGTPTTSSTALVQLSLKSGQIVLPQFVTGQNTIAFTAVDGAGPNSVNAVLSVSLPAPVGNVTTYTEGGSAVALMDSGATTWDIDSPNLASAKVVLTGVQAGDHLDLPTLPAGVAATTDTSVPGQITLDLAGSATPAAYQSLLKAITFSNSGQDPMSNDRTATIVVNDGQLSSNTYTSTIHVVPVDNAPVETAPATQSATEDKALTVSGLSVSDVDANGGSETVTLSAGHGTIALGATSNLTGVTGNGTGLVSFSGTLADIDNAVASLTYTPTTGYVGSDTLTFTTNDNGNSGIGGPLSATKSVALTVNDAPPTAGNDSFATIENQATVIPVQANDQTVAGNTLTITAINGTGIDTTHPVTLADGSGVVSLNTDGTLTFTPSTGYVGTPSFTYTVSDGKGGTATPTVSGIVVDIPPTPSNDSFITGENTAVTIPVLSNDTTVPGNSLAVTAVDGQAIDTAHPVSVANGQVALKADGTLTFTPTTGFVGTPFFTYTVSDGKGGVASATVNGTVVDTPPTAHSDQFSTPENTATIIPVLSNDTTVAGNTLTVTQVDGTTITAGGAPVNVGVGKVALNTDGTLLFTPSIGFVGSPNFTYTVSDGHGGTATALVSGNVTSVPPTLGDDRFTTPEDKPVVIPVLSNDSTLPGNTMTIMEINGSAIVAGGPPVAIANGSVSLNSDGTLIFTPSTGFVGAPSFHYTVSDGKGGVATATVSGSVTAAPITGLANDTGTVAENTPLVVDAAHGLLANDTGPAGDPLAVASISVGGVTATAGSPAVIPGVGTLTVAADGSYVFAPLTGYTGPVPAATVTVRDASGVTATETLAIAITPAPITGLANDTGTVAENTPLVVDAAHGVLANDTGPAGDPLAVASISVGGVTATAGSPAVIPGVGTLTVAADGSYVFAPLTGYTGPVPAATVTVRDASGVTATETLAIAITPAPITGLVPDTGTVAENTPLVVDAAHGLLANDTGPAGDPLAVASISVGGVTATAGQPAVIPGVGTLTVAADGSYVFAPVTGYTGPVPAATITVRDASGVTATETLAIAITPAPITGLANDTGTVAENTPLVVDAAHGLLANDTGPAGDPLAVASISVGGVTATAGSPAVIPGVGTLTVAADGSYVFAPLTGYTGPVPAATVTVKDASGVTATETLAIAITPAPITGLVPDTGTVAENTPLVVDAAHGLLANDTGPAGDPLAVASITVGGVTATAGSPAVIPGVGTLTVAADGSYVFAPLTGYTGPVPAATVTVRDASGVTATETLALAITPAPITGLVPDTGTAAENTPLVVDAAHGVLANDTGPAGDPLAVASISVGGVTTTAGSPAIIPGVGTLTVAADGSYVFAPVTGYTGPVPAATITVKDASGVTATETLAIAITPAPITGLANDTGTAAENTPLVVDAAHGLLANDTGPAGDPLAVASISVGGVTATAGQPAVIPGVGTLTVAADGSYVFAPVTGYTGPVPAATITVRDASGVTATETLAIAITPAPITGLANDTGTVAENTPLVVDAAHGLLANDTGPAGDPLAVASVSVGGVTATAGSPAVIPGVGTLTVAADGSYVFAPLTGYTGPVPAATITVRDASGVTATETLAITATDVAPTATADVATTKPNVPVTIDVLTNDTRIAGNTYTVTEIDGLPISLGHPVSLPDGAGTVALNSDGTVTYTPPTTYYGNRSFTYTIDDGKGGTSSASVTVTIDKPSTFPAANQAIAATPPSVDSSPAPTLTVSGIVVDAVEQSGLNNATPDMQGARIVVSTVNSVQSLNGMTELPDGHGVIGSVSRNIDEQRGHPATFESRQGFDKHVWAPEGITGFSLHSQIGDEAADRPNSFDHKLVVDTMVRDGTLYVQLKNTAATGVPVSPGQGSDGTRYSVLRADGRPIPDWLSSTTQGLLLGHHPVDVERIELRIVATFADGSTITRYLSIDTTTGEIKPLKDRHAGLERPKTLSRQFASLEQHDFDHRVLATALQD